MAYKSIATTETDLNVQKIKPKSLIKGVLTNALSPHPYLFWLSVGAPVMTKAMNQNSVFPLVFIAGFYTCLVGSKVVLALLAGKSKNYLRGNSYKYIMRSLGLLLCVFAIIFFRDGLQLLGIIQARSSLSTRPEVAGSLALQSLCCG